MNALLLDDEQPVLESLAGKLNLFCPEVTIVAQCNTVDEALNVLAQESIDILFLDVNLNGESGFDLIEKWSGDELPSLIFTTAFDEFAVKAIKHAALDYLLKPIDSEDLVKAVRKAGNKVSRDLQDIVSEGAKGAPKKLVIPTTEGMHILNVKEIVRCESSSNYTTFFLADKSSVLASKTMKEYEILLRSAGFERVHKSHLVNLEMISRYISADGGYLLLKEGSTVPVSNRKKEILVSHLKSL
ncbi:MAG: LytTR family DNA-binding domain-containing protein [Bacteroidota bacterium]|nr:LytTR family DNA-binding domain-containing protein [Bacteroidota bacterium]